jgi:hypothetical protein
MNRWITTTVLVALLGGAGASCAGTSTHRIGVNITGDATKGKLSIGLGWTISPTLQTITFSNDGDEGLEFCVLFLDSKGREKGRVSGTIGPNGSLTTDVPPGATNIRAIPNSDCLEDDEEKDDLRSGDGEEPDPFGEGFAGLDPEARPVSEPPGPWHASRNVTLIPDLTGEVNLDSWIAVNSLRASSARTITEFIESHGFTLPLPNLPDVREVDVYYYCESRVDPSAGAVELTFAENDPFEELSILVNGQTVATLAQGTSVATANGWDARRFVLGQALFQYDPAPGATWHNDLEIRYRVEGQSTERVAQFSYEFENAP